LPERLAAEIDAAPPALHLVRQRHERVELDRPARHAVELAQQPAVGLVVALDERARDDLDRAVVELRQHRRERQDLLRRSVVRRHLTPVVRDVDVELRRREADRALVHRLADERLHGDDLVRRRAALGAGVAHDVAADRGVTDVRAHVHGDAAVERVQELAEAAARPAETLRERVGRHALHPRQHLREPAHVLALGGREREAAVARQHRRDTVP
jgi:hypothetical protein